MGCALVNLGGFVECRINGGFKGVVKVACGALLIFRCNFLRLRFSWHFLSAAF